MENGTEGERDENVSPADAVGVFAQRVRADSHADVTVRELLGWFGAKRRGSKVLARALQALAAAGLRPGNAVAAAGIDDMIRFHADADAEILLAAGAAPSGTSAYLSDEHAFLAALQATRYYYLVVSRGLYPTWVAEFDRFTLESVVPRIANDAIRELHLAGVPVTLLTQGASLEAERIYDEDFETQRDYVASLSRFIDVIIAQADEALRADVLRFFVRIGNSLQQADDPNTKLYTQDRYFPAFLLLLKSPDGRSPLVASALDEVAVKGADVLLKKASGQSGALRLLEKAALVLFDAILLREDNELEIMHADIQNAKRILGNMIDEHGNLAQLSNESNLVGDFDDNFAGEVFRFFNAGFLFDAFHRFCLERWRELQSEMDPLSRLHMLTNIEEGFVAESKRRKALYGDYKKLYVD